MKNLLTCLAFFSCFVSLSAQKPVSAGPYRVLSSQYGKAPATTIADDDKRLYKIFADGYFISPARMLKDSTFQGAAGGTYICKEGRYTETLRFFSWDSTAVGTSYTLDYSAEGKFYHHWGTIKSEKYPDFWLDEMMQRVEAAEPLKNKGLEGAWMLESAKWGDQNYDRKTTPDEVAMKIYAYPMVAYGYWNKKTGSFRGAGGGRYQFDGETVTEQLEFSVWEKPGTTHRIAISLGDGTYTQEWGNNREVWRKAPAQ